jgi:two-component system, NtrC family, nitrogen regulation response regulator GlnG
MTDMRWRLMANKLLIIDDEQSVLDLLGGVFAEGGFEVLLEKDGESALALARTERPNVALVDIGLPKKSGLEVLRELKEIDPRICVIIMTGNLVTQNVIEAMKHGAYDYLSKPLNLKQLEIVVNKAFQTNSLTRGIRIIGGPGAAKGSEAETDAMIGSSPEMIEIWKMVGRVADSDATVLIQGDSGTGKELLARAIFNNSRRRNRPFFAVNCAALPETLLESELFGHEKGAFTDAVRLHIGRFEQCNSGTIFLDEIAEMSQKNQAKLLRVLENQEFERVGGSETIKVDVRIIAATNRSLVAAVKDKRFRLDLFYRLKVVTIFLPPLRERLEDIPLLVNHFVRKFSRENNKSLLKVHPAALKTLMSHPWAGNIRELKNVINSAVVFSTGDTLFPEDFEPLLFGSHQMESAGPDGPPQDCTALIKPLLADMTATHHGSAYEEIISRVEESLIRQTMEKYRNNQVHAAKFLGISRNMLRERLKKFQLE